MGSDGAMPATTAAAGMRSGAWRYAGAGLLGVLFWLLVGDLAISIRERAALPSGLELLRRNGASDTTTSLLMSTVPALLSVLLVPILGYHSDRLHSRWGRRRPFLLAAAAVGCAAMLGLACSPALGGLADAALGRWSPGRRLCNLAGFSLFWTLFECAGVSAVSLFSGLVNDVVPSGLLGRFYAVFRIVGLSVGIGFNSWVFALTDRYLPEILLATGLVFGLALLLACLMVHEPASAGTRLAPAAPGTGWRALAVPRSHILECFAYPPYLWAVAAFMLASVTFGPFNTFYQYYAHVAGIPKATLGALTAYGYAVSIASALGIGWLVDHHGALRVSAIIMGLYCGATAIGYLCMDGAASFRVFYLAHVIISGAWFTAAASLPMALFPKGQFVQYNSTKDLMVVLGNILVSSVQGPVLDLSRHDYRLTLLSGALFSLFCVLCLARLQTRPSFNR